MRLLLIDGHYYVYRSFFAIRGLTNSAGVPTNAVYGFVKTIRKMLKDLQPDLAAVIWDEGLPERRTALQPEYKAQRTEMPGDMIPQLGLIRDLVPMMGLASLGLEGHEADDLMASYAVAARDLGHETIVATNDKDLFQLVGPLVHIYSTNKTDLAQPTDPHALLGPEAVQKKWGVAPPQIGDSLALIGDSVDNIPGVPGIGPKTATQLIQQFGSLGALLDNPAAIASEKIREKIINARAQIEQNCEMVRLDLDLPLPQPLDTLTITPRYEDWIAEMRKCEFKSLTIEIQTEFAKLSRSDSATPAPGKSQSEFSF
ncbi:MAG TPA: 5'-3' exonuclease H3TH domain-containing protein [Chthoniobacterales bacterium]|jgi:DNA polymerase-1